MLRCHFQPARLISWVSPCARQHQAVPRPRLPCQVRGARLGLALGPCPNMRLGTSQPRWARLLGSVGGWGCTALVLLAAAAAAARLGLALGPLRRAGRRGPPRAGGRAAPAASAARRAPAARPARRPRPGRRPRPPCAAGAAPARRAAGEAPRRAGATAPPGASAGPARTPSPAQALAQALAQGASLHGRHRRRPRRRQRHCRGFWAGRDGVDEPGGVAREVGLPGVPACSARRARGQRAVCGKRARTMRCWNSWNLLRMRSTGCASLRPPQHVPYILRRSPLNRMNTWITYYAGCLLCALRFCLLRTVGPACCDKRRRTVRRAGRKVKDRSSAAARERRAC